MQPGTTWNKEFVAGKELTTIIRRTVQQVWLGCVILPSSLSVCLVSMCWKKWGFLKPGLKMAISCGLKSFNEAPQHSWILMQKECFIRNNCSDSHDIGLELGPRFHWFQYNLNWSLIEVLEILLVVSPLTWPNPEQIFNCSVVPCFFTLFGANHNDLHFQKSKCYCWFDQTRISLHNEKSVVDHNEDHSTWNIQWWQLNGSKQFWSMLVDCCFCDETIATFPLVAFVQLVEKCFAQMVLFYQCWNQLTAESDSQIQRRISSNHRELHVAIFAEAKQNENCVCVTHWSDFDNKHSAAYSKGCPALYSFHLMTRICSLTKLFFNFRISELHHKYF